MQAKPFYLSKTLWLNTIAIIAIISQGIAGREIISTDAQAVILAAINLVLRLITKQAIE